MAGVCLKDIAIHVADESHWNIFRATCFTLVVVRACAETLGIHLLNHAARAAVTLWLTLRQVSEVTDLSGNEQHSRTIRARSHACATTDTSGCVHC